MRCFCGRPGPWVVAVVDNQPAGGMAIAEDALPACNGHVGLVALNLIRDQGLRPRHAYRLVLRGPDIDRPAPAPDADADAAAAVETFTCPQCGGQGSHLVALLEGWCASCAAFMPVMRGAC